MTDSNGTFARRCLLHLLPAAALVYWTTLTVAMHVPLRKKLSVDLLETLPSDKSIHVMLYAGLAFLLIAMLEQRAWPRNVEGPTAKMFRYAAVFSFCTINGIIEELTQPLTNRSCDLNDLLADCLGAGLALTGFYVAGRLVSAFRKLAATH